MQSRMEAKKSSLQRKNFQFLASHAVSIPIYFSIPSPRMEAAPIGGRNLLYGAPNKNFRMNRTVAYI